MKGDVIQIRQLFNTYCFTNEQTLVMIGAMKQLERIGTAALVIVAHPDDETIWMGGTILLHPDVDWTIVCLCRRDDPDRAPRFAVAMKRLKARGIISDFEDDDDLPLKISVPAIARKIISLTPKRKFDVIFTHGYNGDYGHIRHKGVHRAVKQLIRSKKLKTKSAFFFSYRMANDDTHAVPHNATDAVHVPVRIHNKKLSIIHKTYNFKTTSFEYRSCAARETFNQLK